MTPQTGSGRIARIGVFSGVALALAAGAHALGGGGLPGATAWTFAVVPVLLTATLLTARRCRPVALVTALGALEGLLHVLFHALPAAGGSVGAAPPPSGHGAHLAPGALAATPDAGALAGVHDLGLSPGMVVFHVVATLLTAWAMSRGEAWMWRLADRFRRRLPVARTPRPRRVRPLPPRSIARRPLAADVVAYGGLRGPPVAPLA